MQPDDILQFWFTQAGAQKWYNGGADFDASIRELFEDFSVQTAAHVKKYHSHEWEQQPESLLALIIMLDQFPRNMYRGTKGAFAFDTSALMLARRAVDARLDLKLPQERRAFVYMPYMHSEDLAMQDECVRLMEARLQSESSVFHAKEHRKLIVKFGRFPHRNAILGRQSTPDEINFLAAGGYAP